MKLNDIPFQVTDWAGVAAEEHRGDTGASLRVPTFFSWLGVTMYLTESAVSTVLQTIARFPRGTEVVHTFARADGPRSPFERRSAEVGEQWLSFYTTITMHETLRHCGFGDVYFLTPEDAAARYFGAAGNQLPPPRRTTIVAAVVTHVPSTQ